MCDVHSEMQVRDYLASLRRNDADRVEQMELGLMVVLASLEAKTETGNPLYFRAVLLNRIMRQSLVDKAPDVLAVWRDNVSRFNEEEGEIALSVVASTVVSESDRSKQAKLQQNFQLLPTVREEFKAFQDDCAVVNGPRKPESQIDPNSETTRRLAEYFSLVCERLANGTYVAYSDEAIVAQGKNLEPATGARLLKKRPQDYLLSQVTDLRRLFLERLITPEEQELVEKVRVELNN